MPVQMTAIITARPGMEVELRQDLKALVAATVPEPGCVEFRVFEDLEDPRRFVLWEIFTDVEALRTHLDMEYTKAYFAAGRAESTRVIKHQLL